MKKAKILIVLLTVCVLSSCSVNNEDEAPVTIIPVEKTDGSGTQDPDCRLEECE